MRSLNTHQLVVVAVGAGCVRNRHVAAGAAEVIDGMRVRPVVHSSAAHKDVHLGLGEEEQMTLVPGLLEDQTY